MTHQRYNVEGPLMPPHQEPPRRSRIWLWVTLGVSVPVVAGLITWGWPASKQQAAAQISTHTVLYEAEGSGARGIRSATYTLQSDDGGGRQGEINLPMTSKSGETGLRFTRFKTGDFVYLSIQNGDAAGSVTCRITINGQVISENTSSGGHVIATCKGVVP